MNNRLIFIVEGDSEVDFVESKLLPYLYSIQGAIEGKWYFNAQKITTNRRRNAKGGNISFEYLRNEVNRASSHGHPWITTFLDFFRLPSDFPEFSTGASDIDRIEEAMAKELSVPNFIPYIQKYEFETLLFTDSDAFIPIIDDDSQLRIITETIQSYMNSEEINGGPETAPSKRLKHIFGYEKVHDSHMILENLTIEQICQHCPRFRTWITRIKEIIRKS